MVRKAFLVQDSFSFRTNNRPLFNKALIDFCKKHFKTISPSIILVFLVFKPFISMSIQFFCPYNNNISFEVIYTLFMSIFSIFWFTWIIPSSHFIQSFCTKPDWKKNLKSLFGTWLFKNSKCGHKNWRGWNMEKCSNIIYPQSKVSPVTFWTTRYIFLLRWLILKAVWRLVENKLMIVPQFHKLRPHSTWSLLKLWME